MRSIYKKNLQKRIGWITSIVSMLLFALFILICCMPNNVSAYIAGFKAGRIIDDSVFTHANSMSVSSIQTFLNSKVTNCDTNGTQPATDFGRPDLTHAQYAALRGWSPPPYTCLKSYQEGGLSAAQIIYNVAQRYQINPRVLIVTLQKEQGLVTDTWPLATQYRTATGYGCPDGAPCDSTYYGLTRQLYWTGTMFHAIAFNDQNWSNPYASGTVWYTPYILGNNYIRWSPNAACGESTVYIQNRSTQALYNYTPYRPNQAALDAGYGTGDNCSSYGNRNFYNYFTDWFGSTFSTIYNGFDYFYVFNAEYYLNRYADLKEVFGGDFRTALVHFVYDGMKEGRQASENFSVTSYRNRYQDLRIIFRTNLKSYYLHYAKYGRNEGRIATGDIAITPVVKYGGLNYSPIYDYSYYMSRYSDLRSIYSNDDVGALIHFIKYGMKEGRQASDSFNVDSYRNRYQDLRIKFRNNLKDYCLHYIKYGRNEGRIATGTAAITNPLISYGGINYSLVYDFETYISNYSDLRSIYDNDDIGSIIHFVKNGIREGRRAKDSFNVRIYMNKYSDLQKAFGDNLKSYYLHYIYYGKDEGRIAI